MSSLPVPATLAVAWRRLRGRGVHHWVRRERSTILHVAKTTLAAGLSWELARVLLGSEIPALAALAALLTMQVTVYRTLKQGLQQVVGVIAGVVAAVVLTDALGVHTWSIALLILGGLVLGRMLRLGLQSNQVAISALLVMSLGTGYGGTRVADTILGAIVGMIVSAVVAPPRHVDSAQEMLTNLADDVGDLLADIGSGLTRRQAREHARGWLQRARLLEDPLQAARDRLDQGAESLRFNVLGRRDPELLPALTEGLRALQHVVGQVRSASRVLADAVGPDQLDIDRLPPLPAFGRLFTSCGTAVTAFGHLIGHGRHVAVVSTEAGEHVRLRTALANAGEASSTLEHEVGDLLSTAGPLWRLTGSLLAVAERTMREVDPETGPHVAALD